MGMTNEEREKHIRIANMLIELINDVQMSMLLYQIEKDGGECACCEYNGSGYDNAENCKLIKSMPSVTPSRLKWQEPRQGHWIKVTNGRGGHECDVCHDYAPSFQSGDEYLSAFCPNCGADMREREDKE